MFLKTGFYKFKQWGSRNSTHICTGVGIVCNTVAVVSAIVNTVKLIKDCHDKIEEMREFIDDIQEKKAQAKENGEKYILTDEEKALRKEYLKKIIRRGFKTYWLPAACLTVGSGCMVLSDAISTYKIIGLGATVGALSGEIAALRMARVEEVGSDVEHLEYMDIRNKMETEPLPKKGEVKDVADSFVYYFDCRNPRFDTKQPWRNDIIVNEIIKRASRRVLALPKNDAFFISDLLDDFTMPAEQYDARSRTAGWQNCNRYAVEDCDPILDPDTGESMVDELTGDIRRDPSVNGRYVCDVRASWVDDGTPWGAIKLEMFPDSGDILETYTPGLE